MESAATWVDMCQPSASSAIDPVRKPATISATIVTAVIATTIHMRRSPARLPTSKAWVCRRSERLWIAIPETYRRVANIAMTAAAMTALAGHPRMRRLLGSLDVGDALRVQRDRGRQHDEERDEVRESHADPGVEPDAREVRLRLDVCVAERLVARSRAKLLDLLRGLPEEEIGADRRAEDGDEGRAVGRRERGP